MTRLLTAGAPAGTELTLVSMSGREELGRLPEFQLEFTSPKSDIEPKAILGKNMTWALQLATSELRYFNGFVTRFSEAGEAPSSAFENSSKGRSFRYRATLNPWLWLLTRTSHSRMWEERSVVDVVEEVLRSYSSDFAFNLKGRSYAKRKYIVQYRETDFNFVCRLLEQEGIYFAHKYENKKNSVVLLQSGGTEQLEVLFHASSRHPTNEDHLSSWGVRREVQPGEYTLLDYNYLKPRALWSCTESAPQDHDLANLPMCDYPGSEFDDALEGPAQDTKWLEQYAKLRIEELHSRYETFSGEGNERRIAPGMVINLKEHDRDRYNMQYLVTAVSYAASAGDLASGSGAGSGFQCNVSAVAAKTAFRPARITPKPVIQGAQTAVVVDWEEPEDNLGRVRVKFHWNAERSSCWLRVAQPLAGNKVGFLGVPRPGDEVVVSFLEGNPDRPIVIGSVYNAESMPPYKLPTERTRTGFKSLSWGSSGGFNELRFDDKEGKEEIYIRAQYDKTIRVEHDRAEWVGNDSHLKVGKDVLEEIGAKHHTAVGGDRNEDVGGSVSLKVGTDILGKAGAKIAYDAGKEIHLKAGSTLVLEAGTSLSLKVGGNFITLSPSGIDIKGTLVTVNTGGSAGTGSGASPEKPEAPIEAHKSEGGTANKAPEQKSAKPAKLNLVAGGMSAPQAEIFRSAAASGAPFCEICDCPEP